MHDFGIGIECRTEKKVKPHGNDLEFGVHFTDHMFVMDYSSNLGWHDPRIIPHQPLLLDPASKVFHYGQASFEGMKAYRTPSGGIQLFRPRDNFNRLNRSNSRMCMPEIDVELALTALKRLIALDSEWVPEGRGNSLYIRPFVIATQPALGIAPSERFQFIIILSPVGPYYSEGLKPVHIYVEPEAVRAVAGGVGEAKTSGNYAATFKSQHMAQKQGYAQVMWLDGAEHKYVEEVGSMNVFFVIDGKVFTPALSGSILPGITRDSCLELLRHKGIEVEEKRLSIEEIFEAGRSGALQEAFGSGTAAVISPIRELCWKGERLTVGDGTTGTVTGRMYMALTDIQTGAVEDPFGWTMAVKTGVTAVESNFYK
ncbi:branched-chain amino acid aminotransferase [Paenibacillus sp. GCM10027627]|uniref:branched-chain amino acid aminotransferase n=1 Tax=unclassified Paenibacillus TaxID=185978 RepID=UPI0036369114